MLKTAFLCVAMSAITPLWSQVAPSASGGAVTLDDTRMMTPPPVNGGVFPANVGAEVRSNFVSGGIVVTGAYNDNILPGEGTEKVGDSNFAFVPTIAIDRHTPRQSELLNYSAGFTLYQKTSELNGITQNGSAEYRVHLSPYAVVSFRDSFQQNNNLFNQSNPFAGGAGAGASSSNSGYIFPFQNQLSNSLSGGLEYQYGKNAMIGGGGTYSLLRYSDVSQNPGLANSNVEGASAFWNRRISRGQYLGVIYEYSRITTQPVPTAADTNAISGFYTKYLTSTVSISVKGGPQHYSSTDQASGANIQAWTPAAQGSIGYQSGHTNIVADYSRSVAGSAGLIGAYLSNAAGLQVQRQITRTWEIGASGNYAIYKNVTPLVSSSNPGGHTITGSASLQHRISEHFRAEIGYSRIHQSYSNFGTSAELFPDCNREYGSVTYQFNRPLGR